MVFDFGRGSGNWQIRRLCCHQCSELILAVHGLISNCEGVIQNTSGWRRQREWVLTRDVDSAARMFIDLAPCRQVATALLMCGGVGYCTIPLMIPPADVTFFVGICTLCVIGLINSSSGFWCVPAAIFSFVIKILKRARTYWARPTTSSWLCRSYGGS